MSYESTAEPIKLGYLMDFRLPAVLPAGDAGRPHPDRSSSSSTKA